MMEFLLFTSLFGSRNYDSFQAVFPAHQKRFSPDALPDQGGSKQLTPCIQNVDNLQDPLIE